MKLFVISDLHGSVLAIKKCLDIFTKTQADWLVLLGDVLYHGPRNSLPGEYDPQEVASLLNQHRDRIIAVKGNCDAAVDEMLLDFTLLPSTMILENSRMIYLSHGHVWNPNNLPKIKPGSVLLYGHTHIADISLQQDILCVNPGSCSMSKLGPESYAVIDDAITIYDFAGNILFKH